VTCKNGGFGAPFQNMVTGLVHAFERARARARFGVLEESNTMAEKLIQAICGALTRKGNPCQAKPVPPTKRCRMHGGLSTGPRTLEGRKRVAEAQRLRWARWRENAGANG